MQNRYHSAYMNTLINGILLLEMIHCSIQIYSGISQQKSICTNVYVCDPAGLYHSECHLCVFVQCWMSLGWDWCSVESSKLWVSARQSHVLADQHAALAAQASCRSSDAAATLQDV